MLQYLYFELNEVIAYSKYILLHNSKQIHAATGLPLNFKPIAYHNFIFIHDKIKVQ